MKTKHLTKSMAKNKHYGNMDMETALGMQALGMQALYTALYKTASK